MHMLDMSDCVKNFLEKFAERIVKQIEICPHHILESVNHWMIPSWVPRLAEYIHFAEHIAKQIEICHYHILDKMEGFGTEEGHVSNFHFAEQVAKQIEICHYHVLVHTRHQA